MKIKFIILILLLSAQNVVFAQPNMIMLNGEEHYINGVNLPWNNFGWDFGRHETLGRGYDAEWFENAFADLEATGVNCVRIWVHCDGRANPNFGSDGSVTGLDDGMLDELDDFVTRANDHSLMVIVTLWSHDMLEDHTSGAGRHAGLHSDIIRDIEKTQSYIDHALIPIVEKLKDHCNLLAWEIMNEPEWGMKIETGNSTFQTVEAEEMQRFMGRCILAIRAHSDQNITIGSAKPFGNAEEQSKNYWSESEFQKVGFDCNEVFLDFYSFHYYNWMGDKDSPFEQSDDHWELGKPILLAEIATISEGEESPIDLLNKCLDSEYAGMVFWSYNARDKFSDWQNCKSQVADFSSEHLYLNYDNSCDSVFVERPLLLCTIYPNPTRDYFNIAVHFPDLSMEMEVEIMDANGRRVRILDVPYSTRQIDVQDLPAGFYYIKLRIVDETGKMIQGDEYRVVVM